MTNPWEIEARIRRLAEAAGKDLGAVREQFSECARIWGEGCAIRMLELHERDLEAT